MLALPSPMLLPWKFPCVPRLFSSPEECKVFLFKQKSAAWSWANTQQPLAQDSFFLSCSLQPMHFLAREVFLRERRTLGKYQNCRGPSLYKIPAKMKRSLWLPRSWPSVLQSKWLLPSSIKTDLPKAADELLCWLAEPLGARAQHIWGGVFYESTHLPTASFN